VIDRESAYEILNAKISQAVEKSENLRSQKDKNTKEYPTIMEQVAQNTIVKSMMRTAGNTIVRSLLGSLGLGGRRRAKSKSWL
jgi:hypothetical protein